MRLAHCLTLMSIAVTQVCAAQSASIGCLSYQPQVVHVKGTLTQKTYPGPPNYESVRTGDKAEKVWLIELNSAICVNRDNAEPDLNPKKQNLKNIQLV